MKRDQSPSKQQNGEPLSKNQNLFTVLERGDLSIEQAFSNAIILVGYTRVGKSTVFNWLLNKVMTGAGAKKKSFYKLDQEDEIGAAELGRTFTSVTMDPNVNPGFNTEKEVSLIDMAGFKDSRDHVGAIAVSYFLKSIFSKVRKAKFIIVIPESYLDEENGEGITKTFLGFIDMFPFGEMDKQTKTNLFHSLIMVVTKAKEDTEEHEKALEDILQFISDKSFKKIDEQKKALMTELIKFFIDNNRIFSFAVAVPGNQPEKQQIISKLQKKELQNKELQKKDRKKPWEFFDLDASEHRMKKPVITLPIEKDFASLKEDEQEKFKAIVTQKIESYKKFGSALKIVDNIFSQTWTNYLDNLLQGTAANQINFNFSQFFKKIKQYVKENDVYCSKVADSKINNWKPLKEPLNLVKMLTIILKLHEMASQLCYSQEVFQFSDFIDKFADYFSKIIESLKDLSSNREEVTLLCRLNYVLDRGFKEFKSLYSVKPDLINDVSRLLPDALNDSYDDCRQALLQSVIKPLDKHPQLLKVLFKRVDLLSEYENEVLEYQYIEPMKWKQPIFDFETFISKQHSSLELCKAELNFNEGKKIDSLPFFINTLQNYNQMAHSLPFSSTLNQQEIERGLDELSEKRLKMMKKIVSILKDMDHNQNFNPLQGALTICMKANLIKEAMEIYQKFIKSQSTDLLQRLQTYGDYAQFCASWGLVDKGLLLLTDKLSMEESLEGQKQTAASIRKMIMNKDISIREALNKYNDWKRLPEEDVEIEDVLNQISYIFPK